MNKLKIDMNEVQVFNKLSDTMNYLISYYQDMKGFEFMPLDDGYDYDGTVALQMLQYDSETKLSSQLLLMNNNTIFLKESIGTEIDIYYLRQSPITKTEYKDHLQQMELEGIYTPTEDNNNLPTNY